MYFPTFKSQGIIIPVSPYSLLRTFILILLTSPFSAQTLLLQESFEGSTFPPTGWSIYTPTGNYSSGWTNGPQSGLLANVCVPHGNKTLTSQWATYYPNATWAFTPGLSLSAGTTYMVSFKQCVQSPSSNKTESLKVTVGTQATESSQTTVLLDLPALTNTSPQSRAAVFTPATSGLYYFAFNCYSAANQRYLSIDSVNVYTNAIASSFPSPYCTTSFTQSVEPLTLVNFAGINNTSSASLTSPAHENYTAHTGTVQTNQTYTFTIKGNTNGAANSFVKACIDWNQNTTFDAGEDYNLGSLFNSTGTDAVALTATINVPGNAVPGTTRLRVIKKAAAYPLSACNTNGAGQAEDYSLLVTGITSMSVATQGNVPAYISTNGGALQMTSTIYPSSMNQSVTWNIVAGSGSAMISSGGLVTGQGNGNVWAKATSVADPTKKDSLQITIINQTVAATGIVVKTQNNITALINSNNGTLAMTATIMPSNASQAAIWSIVKGTGDATINSTGMVTALKNGTVWAKAKAQANVNLKDSVMITISNQVATAIGETSLENQIRFFPNPCTREISLSLEKKQETLTFRLYDLTGKLVILKTFEDNESGGIYTIDVSVISRGLYFVELKTKHDLLIKKLAKE